MARKSTPTKLFRVSRDPRLAPPTPHPSWRLGASRAPGEPVRPIRTANDFWDRLGL